MMRILYLYARQFYEEKMSLGRVLYAQALARQSDVELRFWGIGWDGYDERLSLRQNIANDGWNPTHLWLYKAGAYLDVAAVRLPKLVIFNEAHDIAQTSAEISSADASLVGFHHESDYLHWRSVVKGAFHIAHGAEPHDRHIPLPGRYVECMVTGRTSQMTYPLRHLFAKLVEKRRLPGIVRPHPGYRGNSHADNVAQYRSYRRDLQLTRLGLGCSSIRRYNFARFAELAMAGTVIVTDHPDDRHFAKFLADGSILIPGGSSPSKICDILQQEMRDPAGLQQRSALLQASAEKHLSMDRYAQRLSLALESGPGLRDGDLC